MSRNHFLESTLRGFTRALSKAMTSEQVAAQRGLLQQLDPRVRLAGVLLLVVAATFCRRISVLFVLFGCAVVLAIGSRLSFWSLAKRVWFVVFAFTALIAFPALFITPGPPLAAFPATSLKITETGLRTAVLLILRVETAVTLTTALVLSTPWMHILKALRSYYVPVEVVTMLAMTHRYIFLLIESANQMFESRQSRIVGVLSGREQRDLATRTAGVLLSKSIDLSNEVYLAMQSRGYRGEVHVISEFQMRTQDYFATGLFFLAAVAIMLAGR